MATNYPGALDTITEPASTATLGDTGTITHHQHHVNLGDAVEAIEAELGTDPAGTATTVKARLEALDTALDGKLATSPFHTETGRYYWGGLFPPTGTTVSSQTTAGGRMYASPIMFRQAKTLDRIACNIGTGAAGNARLGIYNHDVTTGLPGSLLLDAGTVDVSTTGGKEIVISQALAARTLYWLVYLSDVGASVRALQAASLDAGMATVSETGNYHGVYFTQTYGALPASAPATPTYESSKGSNLVYVRVT